MTDEITEVLAVTKDLDKLFKEQVETLQTASAGSIDPCLTAKAIAATDGRVVQLFKKKIILKHVFKGITCVDRPGFPENKYVVFNFDCAPGTFCLVPPAFMVVVNIIDRYVVAIVDPYIPFADVTNKSGCACTGRAAASGADVKIGCSADVDVYFNGRTICIRGEVGCNGKTCKFDECLGDGDITVDCGDLEVKLKPEARRVCIEARVKIFGNWTPWVDLGCYGA